MADAAVCHLCDRVAPLGGVPDDVGRPVHYLCRGQSKLATAALAQATAKRVARYGQAKAPRLDHDDVDRETPHLAI